jgi:hypothetical protein
MNPPDPKLHELEYRLPRAGEVYLYDDASRPSRWQHALSDHKPPAPPHWVAVKVSQQKEGTK